jgi:hypothetical protein
MSSQRPNTREQNHGSLLVFLNGEWLPARLLDVNLAGIRMGVEFEVASREPLSVRLDLSGFRRTISATVRPIWVHGKENGNSEVGTEFEDIKPLDLALLKQFLATSWLSRHNS